MQLTNCNRIYIFGGTASGKTTLAKKISETTKIPFYTTDEFVYKKDWINKYSDNQRDSMLKKTANRKRWIIEGVHRGDWIFPAFKKADFVIILDLPRRVLLKRVIARYIKRKIKSAEKKENWKDTFLLIKYAYIYKKDNLIFHKQFVQDYKKDYIILKNNQEINNFINNLKCK